MRIVIDMQGAQAESRTRGVGRYSHDFAVAVAKLNGTAEVHVLLSLAFPESARELRREFDQYLPAGHIHVWQPPHDIRGLDPARIRLRHAAELILESVLASIDPDIVHVTSPFEGYADDAVFGLHAGEKRYAVTATLYDLIPLENAHEYLDSDPRYADFYFRQLTSLSKVDGLLTISDSSTEEARRHLPTPMNRIVNVSAGVSQEFRALAQSAGARASVVSELAIETPFVLYFGGYDDRKNVQSLIAAFSQLSPEARAHRNLVLAGWVQPDREAHVREAMRQNSLSDGDVIFTGKVSDDQLTALMGSCDLFVFPSLQEGFGLPVLEAMTSGAPVIASNATSVPEIVAMPEALFDPRSVDDIRTTMEKALVDKKFRTALVMNSARRAAQFSWEKSARKAIDLWQTLSPVSPITSRRGTQDVMPSLGEMSDLVATTVSTLATSQSTPLSRIDINNLAEAISVSLPDRAPGRRIFLDVTSTRELDVRTGVQRVAKAILQEFIVHQPEGWRVETVYLERTGNRWDYFYAHEFAESLMGSPPSGKPENRVEFHSDDAVLTLDLSGPTFVEAHESGLFARLQGNGVSLHAIVFDLLPVTMPEVFPHDADVHHGRWLDTIAEFDSVAAISQTVANELTQWWDASGKDPASRARVTWFPLGADFDEPVFASELTGAERDFLASLDDAPTFLMVGTIEPRKGYDHALEAFTQVWDDGVRAHLVIVGKPGWSTLADHDRKNIPEIERILREHPEAGRFLHWVGQASEALLEELYGTSQCLVAASYDEGFGLPLIEAAHYGLPILARDIPVFREVAGKHATYFSNGSARHLAEGITQWLAAFSTGKAIPSTGMPYLSWAESAKTLSAALLSQD